MKGAAVMRGARSGERGKVPKCPWADVMRHHVLTSSFHHSGERGTVVKACDLETRVGVTCPTGWY